MDLGDAFCVRLALVGHSTSDAGKGGGRPGGGELEARYELVFGGVDEIRRRDFVELAIGVVA